MKRSLLQSLLFAASGILAVMSSDARAAYPDKPVTLVVSFAPGGMTDTVGRILATELGKKFGQTFVVENKAGAAGQVGTEYVARQKNDGYTLLISATGHVIGPAVSSNIRYQPVKDFEPIAILARAPNLFVVNPKLPVNNLSEFIAWGKAQKSVPYGSAGFGGSTHLGGELFRHVAGVPLEHVPYKGASPATLALVSGEIPFAIQDSMSVAPYIKSGQLRPIAVASANRSGLFPDLKTVSESGFQGFDVYTWLGLYAPAGTDSKIVAELNAATNQIMNSPGMAARLQQQNSEPGGVMTLAQVKNFVQSETEKWKEMVKATGVKVDN
jgi:tripartite-type tricarboxylate transporter receptor subunit TctC